MKRSLICTVFLLIAACSFCQQTGLSKQDYLQKSKNQKKAAWIMLGGGAALVVGGAILDVSSDWNKSETPYLVIIGIGGASMLGSIPLFIASGKNKRKAMEASAFFEIQQNPFPTNTGLTLRSIPALSLKLNF